MISELETLKREQRVHGKEDTKKKAIQEIQMMGFFHNVLESLGLNLSGRGSEGNHLFRLGRRRVRLGPILFTTHKIERRKGRALNSEIKRWLPLKLPLKA